jgi:hypothetical protein
MEPTALLPLRRKACWGFFRWLRPGANPRTWVPKASKSPKPLILTDENIAVLLICYRKRCDSTSIKERQFPSRYYPVYRPLITVQSTLYGPSYRERCKMRPVNQMRWRPVIPSIKICFWCDLLVAKSTSLLRRVRASICPFARPHVSARHPQDGFPWNLVLRTFAEICQGTPVLVQIGKKISVTFREDLSNFYCCCQHNFFVNALLCNT